MINHVVTRMKRGAILGADDRSHLDALIAEPRELAAHTEIIAEGEAPTDLRIMVEGFACRYKLTRDGRRAIVGLMLPGDICDFHAKILGSMDHAIGTITECRVAFVAHRTIDAIMAESQAIAKAFWWSTLVDESIMRQWLTSKGRMRTDRQMMHLFCELYTRLGVVGLAHDHGFPFPLTQQDLADTLGVTQVHVQRVIETLRRDGLISDQGRRLNLPDLSRAIEFAQFDPAYLHLAERPTLSR